MPATHVYEYPSERLSVLLAGDRTNFSGSNEIATAKIPPDKRNRTILIGLGGTGVQTLRHVRQAIASKLDPSWSSYVAFLAIDTDSSELKWITELNGTSKMATTLPGVENRAANKDTYTGPWKVFADPAKVVHLTNIAGDGSGRNRLMGKMKIHDKSMNLGVDEEVVAKLSAIKTATGGLLPISAGNPGKYKVYVIGSVSGGTCSGGFTEMPSLIRKAIGADAEVYAMLYMPDTVTSLDPVNKSLLEANGYASLKELNYYQGMYMRQGYNEYFTYNDPANPELKMSDQDGFYQLPYLIGTKAGGGTGSIEMAKVTIGEFFVSILGDMPAPVGNTPFLTDSFLNNAMNRRHDKQTAPGAPEKEKHGTAHEFPKCFAAIGFASASAPKEILKSYTIGDACRKAGIQPVDAVTRAAMNASGETLLPFLDKMDSPTAFQGTAMAEDLLQPLIQFMRNYLTQDFDMVSSIPGQAPVEWKDVYNGEYSDSSFKASIQNYAKNVTTPEKLDELEQVLKAVFQQFRNNVKNYVMQEGPFAFGHIYDGTFLPDNSGNGVGIRTMLDRMCKDLDYKTGRALHWQNGDDAWRIVQEKEHAIKDSGGVIKTIGNVFNGERQSMASEWKEAVDNYGNRLINEKQRARVVGPKNALDRCFLQPAAILATQLAAFGPMLATLSEIYQRQGGQLDSYDTFLSYRENQASVNLAALNVNAYNWLKDQADAVTQTVTGTRVRTALVESFFDKPGDWMDFDGALIKTTTAGVVLVDPNVPIPARRVFEECVMKTISLNVDVSISSIFSSIQATVNSNIFAEQIVNKLYDESSILLDVSLSNTSMHRYIMYPSSLNATAPDVVTALKNAATAIDSGIGFYCSAYTDSIMMYQQAAPFEIYCLNALPEWEKQYDHKLKGAFGLHGRSPDLQTSVTPNGTVSYQELSTWDDYPAITYHDDPMALDKNGHYIFREGEVRAKINLLLDEAKEIGVLYSKQDIQGQWYIQQIFPSQLSRWQFDATLVAPEPNSGLLPTGTELVAEIAKQNNTTLDKISKEVELLYGGLMCQHHATEEDAWTYAYRTLYAHRPMLAELRETVPPFREWKKIVDDINAKILESYRAGTMIRIMQANILRTDADGFRKLGNKVVANFSLEGLQAMQIVSPSDYALVSNGFQLYYLYKKLKGEDLKPYLEQAKGVFKTWDGTGTIETTVKTTMAQLETEIKLLTSMGGSTTSKPSEQFISELKAKDIQDDPAAICNFYRDTDNWKRL